MNYAKYYKNSGKFDLVKTIIFTFIGAAIIAIVSFFYSPLIAVIPFVYFNFFITVGMGICVMLTLGFVAKKSKISPNYS